MVQSVGKPIRSVSSAKQLDHPGAESRSGEHPVAAGLDGSGGELGINVRDKTQGRDRTGSLVGAELLECLDAVELAVIQVQDHQVHSGYRLFEKLAHRGDEIQCHLRTPCRRLQLGDEKQIGNRNQSLSLHGKDYINLAWEPIEAAARMERRSEQRQNSFSFS
jgi:hypothetical protein